MSVATKIDKKLRKFNKKVRKFDKKHRKFAKKMHKCEENMKKNVRKKDKILQITHSQPAQFDQSNFDCTLPWWQLSL